jgi:hypothetical protein
MEPGECRRRRGVVTDGGPVDGTTAYNSELRSRTIGASQVEDRDSDEERDIRLPEHCLQVSRG